MKRVGRVAVVLALVLGGCTAQAGTDGNLTNGWPAMPSAKPVVPVAGSCWAYRYGLPATALITARVNWSVVDCASGEHNLETAYVGTFTGADAASPAPPADDSPAQRAAYATCVEQVRAYLGGDWRLASVWLTLVQPAVGQWRVGARWFRCDLGHLANSVELIQVNTGSVRDGLRGARSLAITCLTAEEISNGTINLADALDCAKPHQAEFVGIFIAPDGAYPAADNGAALADSGCIKAVGHFLGFADAADWNNPTVGYWPGGFDKQRWGLGDRSERCYAYAYTKNKTFVGSVRGIGNSPARSS